MVRRSLEVPTTDTNNDGDRPGPASRTPAPPGESPATRGRRNAAPDRVVPRLHGIRSSGFVVHRRGETPPPRPHPPWRKTPLHLAGALSGAVQTRGFTTDFQPRPPDGCPELRKREPPVPSLQERFALRCKDGFANGRATKPSLQGGSGGRRCSSRAILHRSCRRVNGPVPRGRKRPPRPERLSGPTRRPSGGSRRGPRPPLRGPSTGGSGGPRRSRAR